MGGTGCSLVAVAGQDVTGAELSELVTLTGTTPVVLTNQYYFIFRITCISSGSTGANVGYVAATYSDSGTKIMAISPPEYSVSSGCVFRVPQGEEAQLVYAVFSAVQTASGSPTVLIEGWYTTPTGIRFNIFAGNMRIDS